jgi:hypothetical protein
MMADVSSYWVVAAGTGCALTALEAARLWQQHKARRSPAAGAAEARGFFKPLTASEGAGRRR